MCCRSARVTRKRDSPAHTHNHTGKVLKALYNANQPTAAECCALCRQKRAEGCTAWSYSPQGWVFDATYKCT